MRTHSGRPPRATRGVGAVFLALAAAAGAPLGGRAAAGAQVVLGAGDDATLPGRGEVRVRVSPAFNAASSRLGGPDGTGGRRVPIASEYSTDALGPTQLPTLGPVRDTLRAITGRPALDLSLGTVRVAARTSVTSVPTLVEFGIARRLALAVTIPGVITRSSVGVDVNANGGAGNFGINPLAVEATRASAVARNGAALQNLDSAARQLTARGAAALAAEVRRFQSGIAAVYGSGATGANAAPGAFAVPLAGSDAQAAVAARLAQLAQAGAPLDPSKTPAPSLARVGTQAFLGVLTDPTFGIGGGIRAPLGSYNRSGPGDIDAVVNLNLLDTFGGRGRAGVLRARVAPARGVRLRATVGAGYRVAVASEPVPFLLFDLPPGERSSALLGRAAADLAVGRRFSTSVVARLASPVSGRLTLRVAEAGNPYAPAYRVRQVERRLGRELQLEVTPRYALNDAFALFAQALVRDRAADAYAGTFTATAEETGAGAVTFDAAALGVGSGGRETRAGFGVAYSTVAGYARGRARVPVELSYQHSVLAAASGGRVLNTTSDLLSVRVAARIFGR